MMVPMLIRLPDAEGTYTMQIQLVDEGIGWFGDTLSEKVYIGIKAP